MRRNYRGSKLLAALLVLVMLLCSFPMVYAEDAAAEIAAAELEYTPETEPESVMDEAEPAAETEPAEVPEEEPAAETESVDIPEEAPTAETEPVEAPEEAPAAETLLVAAPEEAPAAETVPVEIPEEEPAAETDPVELPEETAEESEPETETQAEAETEEDADEEAPEDALYEFDDDEVGSVSEELLEIFNNPDTYEKVDFTGSVEIVLKNSEISYNRDVTLVARVSGADMDYRLVWEANDGSGWFAVAAGEEYTFLLTPDIVSREYRVVLFRVC